MDYWDLTIVASVIGVVSAITGAVVLWLRTLR
jgi:hypothetical protein